MRTLLLSLVLLVATGILSAQSCKSAPAVVRDLNKEVSKVLKGSGCSPTNFPACLADPATYHDLTQKMIKFWNNKAGKGSWATIGPRRLDFGEWEQGRLVSTGGRMYLSCAPSDKRVRTVEIKELDGKGKTSYVICKVDRNGNYTKLKTGWINEVNSQKSNKRETRTHTIKGVRGYLISIHFDGKSVGNTFQYKVKVK